MVDEVFTRQDRRIRYAYVRVWLSQYPTLYIKNCYLSPQQLAVGVPGGVSTLVFGVRMIMEVHGDFVVVV